MSLDNSLSLTPRNSDKRSHRHWQAKSRCVSCFCSDIDSCVESRKIALDNETFLSLPFSSYEVEISLILSSSNWRIFFSILISFSVSVVLVAYVCSSSISVFSMLFMISWYISICMYCTSIGIDVLWILCPHIVYILFIFLYSCSLTLSYLIWFQIIFLHPFYLIFIMISFLSFFILNFSYLHSSFAFFCQFLIWRYLYYFHQYVLLTVFIWFCDISWSFLQFGVRFLFQDVAPPELFFLVLICWISSVISLIFHFVNFIFYLGESKFYFNCRIWCSSRQSQYSFISYASYCIDSSFFRVLDLD